MTTVYSCVRILSETLASLLLHVYRYTDKGSEKAKEKMKNKEKAFNEFLKQIGLIDE